MSDEIEKRRQQAEELGTYDDVPSAAELRRARRENPTSRRMVIPGLLPEGYHPSFGSPPKVGKTTMAIDLTSAVMNGSYDGRQFLDYFPPSEIPQEEIWEHPFWYFNAETPPDELEQAMKEAELEEWIDHGLIVENLEDRDGDPTILDVRNDDNYYMWEWMLSHDGGEFDPQVSRPSFVLVDGLTAILGGDVNGYAQWMAAWRRLMRSLQIPSGLVIAHSTWKGDHLIGGMEASAGGDGNWTYERSSGDGLFKVKGRLGGPSIKGLKVRLDPDGRLRAGGNRPASTAPSSPGAGPTAPGRDLKAEVLAVVIDMHSKGMQPSGNNIRETIAGRNPDIDAAVSDLVKSGQLERYDRTLRGGGNAYRPVHIAG